ncbi:effector-associated constant component EACC1 [Streptomyces hydrogenans]|uniref:effector-associated constant component EACC1 n=1 Tax=Streptomyces hydrogenans TaxID=1873719 RepID=UPI0037F52F91
MTSTHLKPRSVPRPISATPTYEVPAREVEGTLLFHSQADTTLRSGLGTSQESCGFLRAASVRYTTMKAGSSARRHVKRSQEAWMRLEVRVQSDTRDLRSLQGWLRSDPDVRRTVATDMQGSTPRPGEMGSTLDVLQLVTGNGWSAASFIVAVAAWRQTRPQRPPVEIHHGDTVIVLTDSTPEEIARVTRALGAATDEEPDT